MSFHRVGVVVNARLRVRARGLSQALARLRESTHVVAELDTRGDESDARRIGELLIDAEPDVLVAAGGDGTTGLALRALLEARCAEKTALALLPLGSGNNAARSFGLRAVRDDADAVALAIGAITGGLRREVDLGCVDGRPFLASVAIGMDAGVLALRNRLH
jgi:diacylglycerol kinase (ATP)